MYGSSLQRLDVCRSTLLVDHEILRLAAHIVGECPWSDWNRSISDLDLIVGVEASACFLQDFPATAFSGTSLAHDEVAVTDSEELVQLRNLGSKAIFGPWR